MKLSKVYETVNDALKGQMTIQLIFDKLVKIASNIPSKNGVFTISNFGGSDSNVTHIDIIVHFREEDATDPSQLSLFDDLKTIK